MASSFLFYYKVRKIAVYVYKLIFILNSLLGNFMRINFPQNGLVFKAKLSS